MVQGGLLTSHPGSVHGNGEAPGGGSSLRQGAGTGSPDSPDLETAATVEQRRDREKGFYPECFGAREIYRLRGADGGPPGSSSAPWERPIPRARHQGAWAPGGGP